jgi:hypothetical protein
MGAGALERGFGRMQQRLGRFGVTGDGLVVCVHLGLRQGGNRKRRRDQVFSYLNRIVTKSFHLEIGESFVCVGYCFCVLALVGAMRREGEGGKGWVGWQTNKDGQGKTRGGEQEQQKETNTSHRSTIHISFPIFFR